MKWKSYLRIELITPAIYLLIVAGFLIAGIFQPENADWFPLSLILTLPWSLITGFLVLGALHLGDKIGVAVIILVTAFINAGCLYLLIRSGNKKTLERSE